MGEAERENTRFAAQERAADAERFLTAAKAIMTSAAERNIVVRLLGSLAYRLRCPKEAHLLDEMDRVLTDLDFASERRFANDLRAMLTELGYIADRDIAVATGGERYFFKHPDTGLGVDIFMDKLHYCHPIYFKNRLQVDVETLPLGELLLEKMQIVELNAKDIKDTIVLLLEHDLDDRDGETINAPHISQILGDDWGFYYTVTTNLEAVRDHLDRYEALSPTQRELVRDRITRLQGEIEDRPKSLKWKARAKVGTRKLWYQPIEAKEP
jgi:hypothetical protein